MQKEIEKVKSFCLKYKKYLSTAGLLVAFVVVLNYSSGFEFASIKDKVQKKPLDTAVTEEVEVEVDDSIFDCKFKSDDNEEMTALLTNYYKAYVNNDVKTLENLASPLGDKEKSYIQVVSNYYVGIDKFNYHYKPGTKKGTYFVSVENEIRFENVTTTAPGLDFFYIETDKKGKLIINNAYSIFNLNFMENTVDADIYALVQKYMKQADFVKLQQQTQSRYNEAVSSDKYLADMVNNTLDVAIKEWTSNMQKEAVAAAEKAEQEKAEKEKAEQEKVQETEKASETEEKAEQNQEAQQTETKIKVITKDVVNVRAEASRDSQQIGQFSADAELTKIGEEGEWSIIEFQNGKGYVKTEFLKAKE